MIKNITSPIYNNENNFLLQVRMLADPTGAFTKVNFIFYPEVFRFVYLSVFVLLQAVDLLLDSEQIVQVLGNKRSKRYAMDRHAKLVN